MLSGWMGVSPELRVEVTFLMTFSSVNPGKIGDGHNMEAVEQAGEWLFPDQTIEPSDAGHTQPRGSNYPEVLAVTLMPAWNP